MEKNPDSHDDKNQENKSPYEDLYVYFLNGVFERDDEADFGSFYMGNWVEDENSFLFFSKPSLDLVNQAIDTRTGLAMMDEFHFSYEDWQGGDTGPQRIEPFLISPPWSKETADKNEVQIILDPGVVFGNCLHPTTRDCLKALSRVFGKGKIEKVLDLGTGTGILALAAARLGTRETVAVDLNPLCIKTTGRNVKLNHLENSIQVIKGRAESISWEPFDLIIANIHYEVLEKIILKGAACDRKQKILFSGLMRTQYRNIKETLKDHGFGLLGEWDHQMTWFTVLAETGERKR